MRLAVALAFAALSFIWGSTYLFIKIGLNYWPPFLLAAARNLVAGVAMLILMAGLRRPLPSRWRDWWVPMLFAVVNGSSFAFIFWGQPFIPSGQTAVLVATLPLFSLLLARWWTREAVNISQYLAVAAGFAGVVLLSGVREGAGFSGSDGMRLLAQLGMLGAALCYAISYAFSKRYFSADLYANTAIHLVTSGFYLLLYSLAFDPPVGPRWLAWPGIGALLYLALAGSALGYWLMFYLISQLGSVRSTYVTLINPLVAVALGALFLGEALSWQMLLGTAAVVWGAWLVNRPKAAGAAAPAPASAPAPADKAGD